MLVFPLVPATEPQSSYVGISHAYRAGTRTPVRTEATVCFRVKFPLKLRVLIKIERQFFRQFCNTTLYENGVID